MKNNRVLSDSLALALVKLLTMLVSIISTMVLSRKLDLVSYGTYSTANLITNTATSLSALGLLDAVNYYYNSKPKDKNGKYINTIFAFVIFNGLITALLILYFGRNIQEYFHNPLLTSVYIYIIFRPMLANLGLGLQNLQVSIGKAKVVAIRNIIISFVKLFAVIITAYYTENIQTIFGCMLIVEAISLVFYYKVLKENDIKINPLKIDFGLIKETLVYCIPMGVYIQTNALSRDLDKYVIGYFENTEKMAIFSNVSTKLPFDVISGPLLMVLIPILTRCINNNDYENGLRLFKANIKLGYTVTFIIGAVVLALSEPAILFLYGDKYLAGKTVFELYILVDMMNFISFSIVLGAKGKTKTLMFISTVALALNLVLNYVFYGFMGFVGPAIATVLVVFATNCVLLDVSSKVFGTLFFNLFDWKHVGKLITELIVIGFTVRKLSIYMENMNINYFIILFSLGALGVIFGLAMNIKEIKSTLGKLDQITEVKNNSSY